MFKVACLEACQGQVLSSSRTELAGEGGDCGTCNVKRAISLFTAQMRLECFIVPVLAK